MRRRLLSIAVFLSLTAVLSPVTADLNELPAAKPLTATPKQARTLKLISFLLEKIHYRKPALDDALGAVVWARYLDQLDPGKNIFTQADIDRFARLRRQLDDLIRAGRLKPAFAMFNILRLRVDERVEYALARLQQPFDFAKDETYLFDREHAEWATGRAALDDLWRKRIKNDILNLRLAGKDEDEIRDLLRARYTHLARRVRQFNADDVFQIFINAYTAAFDPHTNYLLPRARENFEINMRLSLEGIGAILQSDNEYVQVRRVLPGGPASIGGELQADDRIIGVAQSDGQMVDVIGWRLDDVVELIRGPKGSVVKLEILPGGGNPDAIAKIISIRRDTINLEEQAAKKRVLRIPAAGPAAGFTARIGVIELPSFYTDFQGMRAKLPDYRSTTRDVRRLLGEFQRDGIDGLIIDLRGNSGGALGEAVALTGLFIEKGPVVQVKDTVGKLQINRDPDPEIVYTGPLAVLVDGYSASASEIFAGAMQDYRRGIIIGEPTFGKGTVQHLLDLNRYTKTDSDIGQLKATVAQFFRIAGDSTQHRGVIPDIQWPQINAEPYGERVLENALPWQKITAVKFARYEEARVDAQILSHLNELHTARIAADPEFQHFRENEELNLAIRQRTDISLHQATRTSERKTRDRQKLIVENRMRRALGRAPAASSEALEREQEEKSSAAEANAANPDATEADLFLRESARIVADFLDATGGAMPITHKSSPQ